MEAPSQFLQPEIDWPAIHTDLGTHGWATAGIVLSAPECDELIGLYARDAAFRKRVVMQRHGFGIGDYAYFQHPLPERVGYLREVLYAGLAPLANAWAAALGKPETFPPDLRDYTRMCSARNQTLPTPLLLRYGPGGFNCLHRDVYGDLQFPIQAMVMLSRPGEDFTGGEFLCVENRARQQSRAQVLQPSRGELTLFSGGERPVPGKRGPVRATTRHGTSPVERGERHALGVIFHDATR